MNGGLLGPGIGPLGSMPQAQPQAFPLQRLMPPPAPPTPTPPPTRLQKFGAGMKSGWERFRNPSDQRSQLGMAMLGLGQGLLSQQRGEGWGSAAARGIGMGTQGYLAQKQRNRSSRFDEYIASSDMSEFDKAMFAGMDPGQAMGGMLTRRGQVATQGRYEQDVSEEQRRHERNAEQRGIEAETAVGAREDAAETLAAANLREFDLSNTRLKDAASATNDYRKATAKAVREKSLPKLQLALIFDAKAGEPWNAAFKALKKTGIGFTAEDWALWQSNPSVLPEKVADWVTNSMAMIGSDRSFEAKVELTGAGNRYEGMTTEQINAQLEREKEERGY